MKFRPALFLLPLLLLGARATARADDGPADADLNAANQACLDGHYDQAAQLFQQIIDARGYSAALCFDLGNAELKAGHLGAALLNYERARYLAPGDAAIEHNLQLARRQAGLDPDPYRWWQVVLRSIDWTVWAGIIIACLVLILAALIARAFAESLAPRLGLSSFGLRKIGKGVIFVCLPLFLFFGFVELSAAGFNDRIEAVVLTKQTPLRLSPFAGSEQTGTLPEGELVTVETRHNDYLWVDQRDQQSGWVQEKALGAVLPGTLGEAPK